MATRRLKVHPLTPRSNANRENMNSVVSFGNKPHSKEAQYQDRIRRIIQKLKEISVRIDKLATRV